MTDGYKFSHHRQFPVSWLPAAARPSTLKQGPAYQPPILFPGIGGDKGATILKLAPVPGAVDTKLCLVTNVTTAVVTIAASDAAADVSYAGQPVTYSGELKSTIVLELSEAVRTALGVPHAKVSFSNIDENKFKRGSPLNGELEGGYNVSYFTCRAYKDHFESLASDGHGDHIVFFGLQYFIKEYLAGQVITSTKIDEADSFISRYMADVRFGERQQRGDSRLPRRLRASPPPLDTLARAWCAACVVRCVRGQPGPTLRRATTSPCSRAATGRRC